MASGMLRGLYVLVLRAKDARIFITGPGLAVCTTDESKTSQGFSHGIVACLVSDLCMASITVDSNSPSQSTETYLQISFTVIFSLFGCCGHANCVTR